MMVLTMVAVPAVADHPDGPLVEPETFAGNDACKDTRINDPESTTYEFDVDGFTFIVDIETDGTYFSFDANAPVQQVIAKGGPSFNVYDYFGAELFNVTHDSGLHAPINPNTGQPYGLSHISFCFDEPPIVIEGTLGLEKTADASYDREVEWELDKSVEPMSHTGNAGEDAGSSDWEVIATKVEDETNFEVTGEIVISWTTDTETGFDLTLDVSDELDDGTVADISCPGFEGTVVTLEAPADQVTCTYVAQPDDATASLNTVEVEPIDPEGTILGDLTATAPVTFVENLIGDDEVTLGDERVDYSELISESTTEVFPETFPCPADPEDYEDGVHQRTETNVATLAGENTDLTAEAEVLITCVLAPLEASKTAEGSYDRTVTWELDKTVDPDSHTGGPGDVFSSDWTVTATKIDSGPENFSVTGTITVSNDTAIPMPFGVSDELDDGTVAEVDCPTDVVPAGESVVCTYTASPEDASATLNTATISAPGNDDVIATAGVTFVENLIGDDEVLLEDNRKESEDTIDDSTTLEYDEEFACPTDLTLYDADGVYTESFDNTAKLTGDDTDLEASASVTITCALVFQGETVTGAGQDWSDVGQTRRDRTNTWFQYTDETDGTHDLVQGRQLNDVGSVTITDLDGEWDGWTELSFSFDSPWQLEAVAGNVKIEPLDAAPTAYIAPGQFTHHFTEPSEFSENTPSDFSVKVPTASFGYAIHLDAGYWVTG